MIVAEIGAGQRRYRVLDREKEMAQLGLSSLGGSPLTAAAMARGVEATTKMVRIARRWRADVLTIVATSAVREAPNRSEFLRRVHKASGARVRVISAEEEAETIFRAITSEVDLGTDNVLCIDIGGGSTELVAGTAAAVERTASIAAGSLRMAERFALTDRARGRDLKACRAAVREIAAAAAPFRAFGIDRTFGTSGTVTAIADVLAPGAPGALRRIGREQIESLVPQLALMPAAERRERFGFSAARASTIVAGAIILAEVLLALDAEAVVACRVALREGLIEAWIASRRRQPSPRRGSVLALAQRFGCEMRHALRAAQLARRIFDDLRPLHGLADSRGELLEYAAMLHDVGAHLTARAPHLHNYYLIRHGDLRGFDDDEIAIIAGTARAYRTSPEDDLPRKVRPAVRRLAPILRLAVALDRGHRGRVRDVRVELRGGRAVFALRAQGEVLVELDSARREGRELARTFGVEVAFTTE
jgi:exopolyphosphatase/guanosine-5'-triphosphate,3'-diphosphate pyrophosphatase